MKFEWCIENFSTLGTTNGTPIKSEPFLSHQGKCKWSLCLYPNGLEKKEEGYVSLFLALAECPPEIKMVEIVFELCIVKDKDQMVFSKEKSDENKKISWFDSGNPDCLWGYGKFAIRSDILDPTKGYLSGDKLVVAAVDLTFLNVVGHGKTPLVVNDYLNYFTTGTRELSDFKIVDVNGTEQPVHRVFLAKHSRVFAAMFKSGMKEVVDGQVTIDHIRPEVLSKMLLFLYSGKFEIKKEDVEKEEDILIFIQEIIKAGDYYEITPLKSICGKILIANITYENVISFLVFSHTYRCPELKDALMEFIDENKEDLIPTEEWIQFQRNDSELANEVICKMLNIAPRKELRQH